MCRPNLGRKNAKVKYVIKLGGKICRKNMIEFSENMF